jgi:hypothetical protein
MVDLTGPTPILRRLGAISVEQLREVVPDLIVPEEKKPEPPKEAEPVEPPQEEQSAEPPRDEAHDEQPQESDESAESES